MSIQFSNNIKLIISDAVQPTDTEINLVSVLGLPDLSELDAYALLSLVDVSESTYEIVRVDSIDEIANTLTVQRAQEGTLALALEPLDEVRNFLTKGGLDALRDEIIVGQIPYAELNAPGLVEIATQTEMNVGAPLKATTPEVVRTYVEEQEFLKNVINTNITGAGIYGLVQEGDVNTSLVTKLKESDGITISAADGGSTLAIKVNGTDQTIFNQNGYTFLPSGLIIQWGQVALTGANASATISLPTTFPSGGFVAVASFRDALDANGFDGYSAQATFPSTSTLTVSCNKSDVGTHDVSWIAIGH